MSIQLKLSKLTILKLTLHKQVDTPNNLILTYVSYAFKSDYYFEDFKMTKLNEITLGQRQTDSNN